MREKVDKSHHYMIVRLLEVFFVCFSLAEL